jgi:hypothetical protein
MVPRNAEELSIRREFDGAVVFLTGVTGFVGGILLEQLLRCTTVSVDGPSKKRDTLVPFPPPFLSSSFFLFAVTARNGARLPARAPPRLASPGVPSPI